jgi:pyruvate dehydrogenase E2 component (dihydrolipoamide acetyltransferase)
MTALASQTTRGRPFASPLSRRLARQAGLNLDTLKGSGPRGRIVRADIEAALSGRAPIAEPAIPAPPVMMRGLSDLPGLPAFTEIPNSNIRKIVARRLSESKKGAPHFYLSIDCEVDRLLAQRTEINAHSAADKPKVSVNDLVIKIAALALRKVPAVNASWTDAAIRRYAQADISVAVAIPDGLITPVVRAADRKSVTEIAAEMKDLAERARAGRLRPEEFQGGTFSISNLGMHGVREFYAVINPPQAAILAVGAAQKRPVVKDDALAIATVMTCTMSIDHRVVDGAVGAEFLATFKKLMENPLLMLV